MEIVSKVQHLQLLSKCTEQIVLCSLTLEYLYQYKCINAWQNW